jgi:RNA polymerase sigma-70 factor (ECF subfamily)
MASDAELLTAWRAGDERAGELLVTRHYVAIERFFINKARAHAGDLIQRTFLVLLEARERIHGDGDVRRYLFGIARNVLHDHFRSVCREDGRLDFGSRSVDDLSPTPNTLILHNQRAQQLLEALRRIPLDLQIVLELYYWEDMTAPELAVVLAIPQASVRTRIRRAKQKLARELSRIASAGAVEQTQSDLDAWARAVREQLASAKRDG